MKLKKQEIMKENIKQDIEQTIFSWESDHSLEVDKKKIFKHYKDKLYYHYTSLETFWKIVEDDIFHARNVRFSNDIEEYQFGEIIIKKYRKKDTKNEAYKKDCYMICFSEEDNLLSQWREYAKGGVAIGFDFSIPCVFTILNNDKTTFENSKNIDHGYDGLTEETKCYYHSSCNLHMGFLYKYSKPINVLYAQHKQKDEYEIIDGTLTFDNIVTAIGEIIKKGDDKHINSLLNNLIPYIKHADFKDEKEARMLFYINFNDRPYKTCYLDSKGVKIPYIKIAYGDPSEGMNDCQDILISDQISNKLKKDIIKYCKTKKIKVKKIFEEKDEKERFKKCRIIVSNGCNQKEVFFEIQNIVEDPMHRMDEKNKNLCIWCKGHLPIRTITIGPSYNKRFIKESIEHYKESLYWLYYVDVIESETPYRSKK